jgi:hypothetical protein
MSSHCYFFEFTALALICELRQLRIFFLPRLTQSPCAFNWAPRHKSVLGSGVIGPRILHLGIRWRQVVNFTLGGWVGPTVGLDAWWRENFPGSAGARTIDRPARSHRYTTLSVPTYFLLCLVLPRNEFTCKEFFSFPPRLDRFWCPPRLLSNGYWGLLPQG